MVQGVGVSFVGSRVRAEGSGFRVLGLGLGVLGGGFSTRVWSFRFGVKD